VHTTVKMFEKKIISNRQWSVMFEDAERKQEPTRVLSSSLVDYGRARLMIAMLQLSNTQRLTRVTGHLG
jgi:hypothetical protein